MKILWEPSPILLLNKVIWESSKNLKISKSAQNYEGNMLNLNHWWYFKPEFGWFKNSISIRFVNPKRI